MATQNKSNKKVGRPTSFTEETIVKLEQAIQLGSTYKLACDYAGIGETIFHEWKSQGEQGIEPFAEFVKRLKLAEGKAAVGWLAKIEKAANDGQWQAAAWKLERRYPHDYGKQVQEIQGQVTHEHKHKLEDLVNALKSSKTSKEK